MMVEVTSSKIRKLSVRLPPFNFLNPRVWFIQLESAFFVRGITEEVDRFYLTVTCLPLSAYKLLDNILENIPHENPYSRLKTTLLLLLERSPKERLNDVQLNDLTPSQLLDSMRDIIATHEIYDVNLRQWWLQRLPINVRQIMNSFKDSVPLEKLASFADKVMLQLKSPSTSQETLRLCFQRLSTLLDDILHCLNSMVSTSNVQIKSGSPTSRSGSGKRRDVQSCSFDKHPPTMD